MDNENEDMYLKYNYFMWVYIGVNISRFII